MRWWRPIGTWRLWSSRRYREQDLDQEIRAHLETEEQQKLDS